MDAPKRSLTRMGTRVGLAALLAVGAAPLLVDDACACSCAQVSVAQQVAQADLVATATVIDVDRPTSGSSTADARYRMDVERVYKGDAASRIDVHSAASGASCGLENLTTGEQVVLFATGGGASWSSTLCSGTGPRTRELVQRLTGATGAGRAPTIASNLPPALEQHRARSPFVRSLPWLAGVALAAVVLALGLRRRGSSRS